MTRDIVIDADHILFLVCNSKDHKDGFESDDDSEVVEFDFSKTKSKKLDLSVYKKHFKQIIDDYVETAEVESICYNWTIGKLRVILSDKTNFRYEIFPEYKNKRPEKNEIMSQLKKWAMKKYHFEPNTEADDVVAYYVRKGGLGFTTDKDLFKGVAGIWFNSHYMHRRWIRTNDEEANKFFMCQSLSGDGVDGIPAIAGIGLVKAKNHLEKVGYSWDEALKFYISKGHDKDYMQTMVRLVAMNQWTPKKGVQLWKLKDNLC